MRFKIWVNLADAYTSAAVFFLLCPFAFLYRTLCAVCCKFVREIRNSISSLRVATCLIAFGTQTWKRISPWKICANSLHKSENLWGACKFWSRFCHMHKIMPHYSFTAVYLTYKCIFTRSKQHACLMWQVSWLPEWYWNVLYICIYIIYMYIIHKYKSA